MVRQYHVESVAQTVQDEELVGNCDHNNESVVEGPFDVGDVLANEPPLPDWSQALNPVWVKIIDSSFICLGLLSCWYFCVVALLGFNCKRVLLVLYLSQVILLEHCLLNEEFGAHFS